MEKLTEKQTEVETVMSEVSGFPMPQLDPRVLEVYKGVREVRAEIESSEPVWSIKICFRFTMGPETLLQSWPRLISEHTGRAPKH